MGGGGGNKFILYSVLEPNQEPSEIHWDGSVFIKEVIFRNIWFVLILLLDRDDYYLFAGRF